MSAPHISRDVPPDTPHQEAPDTDLVSELGFRVLDDEDDDPVLLQADGTPVDTWRQDYPYRERLPREVYDRDKRLLQIELLKLQYWAKRSSSGW